MPRIKGSKNKPKADKAFVVAGDTVHQVLPEGDARVIGVISGNDKSESVSVTPRQMPRMPEGRLCWDVSYKHGGAEFVDRGFLSEFAANQHAQMIRHAYGLK